MKETNLNYLFIDLVPNFAHLLSVNTLSKQEFAEKVKETYSLGNPKTELFYQSILRSEFDTIRLDSTRTSILLNQ